jgi:hypothetical protein
MSNPFLRGAKQRLLSPRIYIYTVLLLAIAWLMHRHAQRAIEAGQRPPEDVSLFAEPPPADFPVKDSQLHAVAGQRLPLLLLLGKRHSELESLREALQPEWGEKYSIVVLQAEDDAAMLRYFKTKSLPTAILFTPDNDEQARHDAPFDAASIALWLQSLQQQAPEVP